MAIKELIEDIARALVDEPEAVSVEEFEEDDGAIVFELRVAAPDLGKVIGRQGRTAGAVRCLLDVAGEKQGQRYLLDIME